MDTPNTSKRVEFRTVDGVTLRGDFFQAARDSAPIVVMSPGLTVLKEHYFEETASRFAASGISALVYDHRGYGSSDGSPRHQTDAMQQAEDNHDAVTAAMRLPGVDRDKVAIWGVGHGGAQTMIAAATDPRIAAAILNMPIISGALDAQSFPPGLLDRAWRDRERITTAAVHDPAPTYVQLWPGSEAEAKGLSGEPTWFSGEVAYNFITPGVQRAREVGTPWENKLSLASFYHLARVEPRDFLRRISVPTLYLAAQLPAGEGDVELHRDVAATGASNVEFHVLDAFNLDTFHGEPLNHAVSIELQFLHRVLG